jgi:hypothetical protein
LCFPKQHRDFRTAEKAIANHFLSHCEGYHASFKIRIFEKMKLSPHLFWDTDPDKIDYEKNARKVIERVLTRGTMEEVRQIQKFYGHERILSEMQQARSLDRQTLNFLCAVYHVSKEDFRCSTTPPSIRELWPY